MLNLTEKWYTLKILRIDRSITHGTSYSPGRFVSFQLGWKDFLNHPIAGFGGRTEERYGYQFGAHVAPINGFVNIMGRYGLIGLSLFFFLIFKTGKWLAISYSYSGFFIFPMLILIFSFSFGIVETPLFVSLLLVPVFLKLKTKNFTR